MKPTQETGDLPFAFSPLIDLEQKQEPKQGETPAPVSKPTVRGTAESLAMEKDRPEGAIYLFKRGSFVRAYNGSAHLVSCIFRSEYKILRDKPKGGEPYVYLGFPLSKLEEVFSEGCNIEEKDGYFIVTVDNIAGRKIPSYDAWLGEAKISDKKETELPSDAAIPIGSAMHISNAQEVALRLATYHMESHTLLENLQFLSELIAGIEYKN